MIKELSDSLGVTAVGVSGILGTYYYTYASVSLIAGAAFDRAGAKYPIVIGTAIICIGCLIFAVPSVFTGNTGRLLQGAGSAFAFTGCVYLASRGFSAKYIATAIGITQCMGMLGGSAGQFVIGPLIHNGLSVGVFWTAIGIVLGVVCVLLLITTPKEDKTAEHTSSVISVLLPYKVVFTNIQSYLSGLISGLLFVPTTIFAMTWGIAFFQHDRNLSYVGAVIASSMVPLGWVIGCPLLGWISDMIGRRKPVLSGGICLMLISFGQVVFLPDLVSLPASMLLFGIASGAAMIPYTIIKEANPDKVKGSATGAINFLTFSITALIGPVFGSRHGKTLTTAIDHLAHFKEAGIFLLAVMSVALVVSLIIKETGSATHQSKETAAN
ncbi:MFS transporter [Mucilaginibacter sp. R11]|uniref:Lysosomal dipeptide transporter MFSD1 n=2 Tax=Mucilaginibacter agri TaxID=2695265 RepID=A0A965ZJ70_9SPHI|nr:MFS transporter [Mucilaginibacter agri]